MDETFAVTNSLKPALASIRDACKYLGGVSRAKFYADILPKLDTVHLDARHFVVVASMDRFITTRLESKDSSPENVEQTKPMGSKLAGPGEP
jgi:hypothetical protein